MAYKNMKKNKMHIRKKHHWLQLKKKHKKIKADFEKVETVWILD